MPHDTVLIATVAAGLGVAFVLGLLAARLKLPPIVGYLLAGIVVGPVTPGYVADAGLARQLAEFGVILLMFGVGLRFSMRDLAEVRGVVVPGALVQILITGSVTAMLARSWGWHAGGMIVLALSAAVASTVVLLKGLEARDRLDSAEGRIAVGWLVVEDLAMVLALVLLPALGPMLGASGGGHTTAASVILPVAAAMGKVAVFVLLMVFVGRRAVPWLLEHVARLGSRELFTLAVLVSALGVGTVAAELFGVSFALGAFFAGAVISESELSQRAAADALPLQDAFAVLFFVSVGMLFQPHVVFQHPLQLASLVAVIVVGKTAVAFGLMRLLRQTPRASVMMGAALGQIGEFSFIVAALGVSMGLLDQEGQALIVAAALIAITINGPVLSAAVRVAQRFAETSAPVELMVDLEPTSSVEPPDAAAVAPPAPARVTTVGSFAPPGTIPPGRRTTRATFTIPRVSGEAPFDFSTLTDHVILVGHGRVGNTVSEALTRAGIRYVVVEERERVVAGLRKRGELAVFGDGTRPDVLERAGIAQARLLVVTAPEPIRARRIVEIARRANETIAVAVRTHSGSEQAFFEHYLSAPGATGRAVYAEREAALSLAHYSLLALGRTDDEADIVIDGMRGAPTRPTETFASLPTAEFEAFIRASEAARMRKRKSTPPPHVD